MDYVVGMGAVDGVTGENRKTVDGKDLKADSKILKDLNNAISVSSPDERSVMYRK
jgi:hypothetical protein